MKKILIVDDSAYMRARLRKILKKNGYEITGEAENAQSAISKFKNLNPDLVTLDLIMPDENGIYALKELKKLNPKCKIVMISALGQEGYIREALVAGAKDFIIKPFDANTVLSKIQALL